MQSRATTVAEYLASLPADRRQSVERVRRVILDNLDGDYREGMQYGMIGYFVPHSVFAPGYHCDPKQPLPFAGLASQKGHLSLYLMAVYGDSDLNARFQREWKATGKKLDMGKACVRFKSADDVPLEVIGAIIRAVPAKAYIERYTATLGTGRGTESKKAAAKAREAVSARTGAKASGKAKPAKKPAAKASEKTRASSRPGKKKAAGKKAVR